MTRPLHNCNEHVRGAWGRGFYRLNRDAEGLRHRSRKASNLKPDSDQESIMQVKQMFVIGALALATGAVFAQEA